MTTIRHNQHTRRIHRSARDKQRGMTLLVGLILLLMLSVLATIGFRNTSLSERMTGNSVDRTVSFQSAESAGKEALTVLAAGAFNVATLGHYAVPIGQGGTTNFWTQGNGVTVALPSNCPITTPFSWTSCAAEVPTRYDRDAGKAKYAIELLTQVVSGGSTTSTYRVTSRSTGGSGNADVVLQTIFVRTTTP